MIKQYEEDNGFLRKDNNGFYLEPIIGAKRIECWFNSNLLELALNSVGMYVTIEGEFKYREDDKFPFRADVRKLKIMPNEDELPTLYDLHGVLTDFPEGVSSEEFVRNMRDNEW